MNKNKSKYTCKVCKGTKIREDEHTVVHLLCDGIIEEVPEGHAFIHGKDKKCYLCDTEDSTPQPKEQTTEMLMKQITLPENIKVNYSTNGNGSSVYPEPKEECNCERHNKPIYHVNDDPHSVEPQWVCPTHGEQKRFFLIHKEKQNYCKPCQESSTPQLKEDEYIKKWSRLSKDLSQCIDIMPTSLADLQGRIFNICLDTAYVIEKENQSFLTSQKKEWIELIKNNKRIMWNEDSAQHIRNIQNNETIDDIISLFNDK